MLGNKKVREILDTLDGVGTGHGASIDELYQLKHEIEQRIKEVEAFDAFATCQLEAIEKNLQRMT